MNLKETLRYLGYKGGQADEQTLKMVQECWKELEDKVVKRTCFREFSLSFSEDGEIDMGCLQTKSQALGRNLKGCEKVVLFAATLGVQTDTLIRRYSHLQMSKAVVMQAAAAAMLEDYCDEVNEKIRQKYEKKGYCLRPRFSPGYGDFPLECQPALLKGLEAGKGVGITLTDSFLMVPSKSVTAVIGISQTGQEWNKKGCKACDKTDCLYRRETV